MSTQLVDDAQKYSLEGLDTIEEAHHAKRFLAESGYDMCEIDFDNQELIVPLLYAESIDDIEELLAEIGITLISD